MKNLKRLGALSGIIGMILYRVVSSYDGVDGQRWVMYGVLFICFLCVMLLLILKEFLVAVLMFSMIVPLIIATIGMYLDNLFLVGGGIILLFIVILVLLKITPYLGKYKK